MKAGQRRGVKKIKVTGRRAEEEWEGQKPISISKGKGQSSCNKVGDKFRKLLRRLHWKIEK